VSDSQKKTDKPEPRTAVQQLPPYVQGKSDLEQCPSPIKLSSNESPFGPSPKVLEAVTAAMAEINRYPDGSQHALRNAIAQVHGLDANRIVCGSGSSELLDLLIRSYLGPGDELLISENTFVMVSIYALAQGVDLISAPEKDFTIDVDALLARLSDKTRMVVIANPNNPTGTYLNEKEILRLHAALPKHVLLVLDAAYGEFVDRSDYNDGASLAEKFDNVVVTRTFSKAYGLAGLRIGWGYFPAEVCEVIQRLRIPFNITNVATAAAIAAVQDTAYLEETCTQTRRWMERIGADLAELGLHVVPSVANFYLIDFSRGSGDAASAQQHLEASGIIPRPVRPGGGGGADVLRITVGADAENEALLSAMREYVSSL
jgi:histidinol-phosphate aminotransferase